MKDLKIYLATLFTLTLLTSCGDKSVEDSISDAIDEYTEYNDAPEGSSGTLTGTAAVGAPVPNGIVKIKCSDQTLPDAATDAFGKWSVNVESCTAPYLIRVQGSVGGKEIDLLSAADSEDVGAIVNVTPITHMVVANMIGDADPAAFDSLDVAANVSKANIEAQEAKIKTILENVIKAATGEDDISDFDLLNTPFATDHSGLDAVLDVIKIEVDGSADTIEVKLADGSTLFTDDATDDNDISAPVAVDATKVAAIVETYTSVDAILRALITYVQANASAINSAQSVAQLPEGFEDIYHADFLDRGHDAHGALHEWFGLSNMDEYRQFLEGKQADFANVNIILNENDSSRGIMFFDFILDGEMLDKGISLQVAKEDGIWQLLGDQIPFEFRAGITIKRELSYTLSGSTTSAADKIVLEIGLKEGADVGTATKVRITNDNQDVIALLDFSFEDWDNDGVHDVGDGEPETISGGIVTDGAWSEVELDATLKSYFTAGNVGEYNLEFLDDSDSLVGSMNKVLLSDPNLLNHNLMPSIDVSTPSGDITLASDASNLATFCDSNSESFDVTIGSTDLSLNSWHAYISGDSGGGHQINEDFDDETGDASGQVLSADASSAGLTVSSVTYKRFGVYLRSSSETEYAYDVQCN